MKEQRGAPHVAEMLQIEVDAFADDAGVLRDRGADQIGSQFQHRVVIELCGEPLFRQFDPISRNTREADFQGIAFGTNGLDLNGLAGRLRRGDDRLRGEIERNPQHVRIFDVEEASPH